MRRLVAGLLSTAALLAASAARAEDISVAQAKIYFDAGAQAYSLARYPVAIEAFEQAYKLAPRAAILFSMAQAERKEWFVDKQPQVLRSAIKHYHAYLDQTPSGGRRPDAAQALAELEQFDKNLPADVGAKPAAPPETKLMVASPTAGATVVLDGKPAGELPQLLDVTPGKHRIRVSAPGFFDDEREVIAVEGSPVPSEVELREKPALLSIATDASADVAIDGRTVARTPLTQPLEVSSGEHFVAVTCNGHKAFARVITFERAKAVSLPVRFEKTGQRVTSLVFFGAGVTVLLTGAAFVAVSLVEQGRAESVLEDKANHNIHSADLDAYAHAVSLRDDWRTTAAITLGAGAATLAAGAVLYAFDAPTIGIAPTPRENPRPAPARPKEMEISAIPLIGPGLMGAGVVGRF